MVAYTENCSTTHSNFIYSTILDTHQPNGGHSNEVDESISQPQPDGPQARFVQESDAQRDLSGQNNGDHDSGVVTTVSQPQPNGPQAWFVGNPDVPGNFMGNLQQNKPESGAYHKGEKPQTGGYKIVVRVVADIENIEIGEGVEKIGSGHIPEVNLSQSKSQNTPWLLFQLIGPPAINVYSSSEGAEVEIILSGKKVETRVQENGPPNQPGIMLNNGLEIKSVPTIKNENFGANGNFEENRRRKRIPRKRKFGPGQDEFIFPDEERYLERTLCFYGLFKLEKNPHIAALVGAEVFQNIRTSLSNDIMDRAQFERKIDTLVAFGKELREFHSFQQEIDNCMYLCYRMKSREQRERCAKTWFVQD